jgi:dTDP-4-dehydrorhamnose reductase
MQKVLITGANGFIGSYLIKLLLNDQNCHIIATGKGENRLPFNSSHFTYLSMDFTSKEQVNSVFQMHRPDVVIHSGAISKPDECELNQQEAYRINVEGTQNLLAASRDIQSFFIYISTDFVFAGDKDLYTEQDERKPVNYYGQTKLIAEEEVKMYPCQWAIVRTVLVYGKPFSGRQNLLTMVAEALRNGKQLKIFDDQTRTPTYVEDLANGIIQIIKRRRQGIYHLSGKDIRTPYEIAIHVAEYLGLDRALITKVAEKDFAQPARRPPRTVFDLIKALNDLDYNPISIEEGMKKTFE